MLKFINSKIVPKKLGNTFAMLYENWIIPPQNESLIEIKRKEFRERTKYLDPKILYTLNEEEKNDLRNQGYFVDLNEKTIKEIKNFKLTYNRHLGKYNPLPWYYNFAAYNTKYYYNDQNTTNFYGDPQFQAKIWRNRSRIKKKFAYLIIGYIIFYIYYRYRLNLHNKARKYAKKIAETNPELIVSSDNIS